MTTADARLTRELLEMLDKEHRENHWDWENPISSHFGYGVPWWDRPVEPTEVVRMLYLLYEEAGLHASQGLCDEHFRILRDARRLLGRLAEGD